MSDAPAHRRFSFDTVFDGDRIIEPKRAKQFYSPQEVEAARAEAFAEGQASAVSRAEAAAAQALREVADIARGALATLAEIAHEHRTGSAQLALATGRAIAGAALDRFPEAPALAALDTLSREIGATPKLVVQSSPGDAARLEKTLNEAAARAGFAGQIVFRAEPGRGRAAFAFDWGEGRAAFDPEAAAARVTQALEAALAAEGLHAEVNLPPLEQRHDPS